MKIPDVARLGLHERLMTEGRAGTLDRRKSSLGSSRKAVTIQNRIAQRLETSKGDTKRQALLVIGMHRSGTSAIARMFNLLGAEISENLLPAGVGNELGHWEQADVLALHEEMLTSAGSSWDDLLGIKPSWFRSKTARDYGNAVAELIRSRFGSARLLVVKDPRIALFVPVWVEALSIVGVEPRFVLPFRHPLEVELSLKARYERVWDTKWPRGQGELLWLRYVLAAEKATRGHPRSFVLFDALLKNWRAETKRIASQVELDWPRRSRTAKLAIDEFLDRKHKHETVVGAGHNAQGQASAWFGRVFNQLLACVDDPQTGAEVFDGAELALSDATDLFVNLVTFFRNPMEVAQEARATVTQATQALAQARHDLAERDRTHAERDRTLAQARQTLAQAWHDLAERDRTLAERDRTLAQGTQVLEETQTALGRAKQAVVSRNRALVDLRQALVEAEASAKAHEEAASNYRAALRAIETSTTWRMAGLLRTFLTKLRSRLRASTL